MKFDFYEKFVYNIKEQNLWTEENVLRNIFLLFTVSFLLSACAAKKPTIKIEESSSSTIDGLYGKTYALSNMFQKDRVTITFEKDKFFGKGPVNGYFGSYKINGDSIKAKPIASTKMGGSPQAMKNEDLYFSMLGKVEKISIEKSGNFVLTTSGNEKLIYTEEVSPVKK